ncbi:hypothetical protein MKL11_01315 [Methylobacterium sp. J-077]|nr:hypothetical protein [Methylobacterium sp. J-077]MCJ2121192.1 hypothetical protein [Methylobacterium sp. J-077]
MKDDGKIHACAASEVGDVYVIREYALEIGWFVTDYRPLFLQHDTSPLVVLKLLCSAGWVDVLVGAPQPLYRRRVGDDGCESEEAVPDLGLKRLRDDVEGLLGITSRGESRRQCR